ncbi:MAG: toll/interleukin-1 receptor domain-containing protein [Saprospiraceae bacterium]|nr:toll/interleukin-1 receptor domain-containing protein [Saprospiraceae bacterium]MCB0684099.1 toll/interleukin-1 receptor domain-containing protein [Saprospiraceae bacterium]
MKEKIRSLIAQGRTEEALRQLQTYGNEFTLLQNRLERVQRENRMGILRRDDYSREINSINFAILEAIETVGSTPTPVAEQPVEQPPAENSGKQYRVFLSYAHKDQALQQQLDAHFAALKRSGRITWWDDTLIQPGSEWHDEIHNRIRQADLILLLVSADFLNSKYIWEHELTIALERQARGEVRVVPVILRPCDWQDTPFARLQALPAGAKPVTQWNDADEAFLNVVLQIKQILQ